MMTVLLNPKTIDQHLDPKSIPFTNDFYLLENLTTRLISLDENGTYQLELASHFEKINDLEYIIKIKESRFSNGDLITLEDVKKSFERALRSGTSHVNLNGVLKDLNIKNEKLVLRLIKPSKSFIYYLSLPDLGILHKSQYDQENLKAKDYIKVSSGPFSYTFENSEYFLVKNRHYKLSSQNYPDKIKLLNYFKSEPHKLLLNGDAEIGKLSVEYYLKNRDQFILHKDLKVIGTPSSSLTYLYFNKYSSNFKKPTHRAWLKGMILKNFEVDKDLNWISRSTKQYFPPESKAYLSPKEVENHLLDAGEKPSDFPSEVVIHTYSTAYKVTVEQLVRKLESVPGIKITIKNDIDPNSYVEDMKQGKFDIFLNIMSTDFRAPVEAINFEFFSKDSPLSDKTGEIKASFERYQASQTDSEEEIHLKKISASMLKSDQIIPLFHSAIPYVYNSKKVGIGKINHLFIFNFWKFNQID